MIKTKFSPAVEEILKRRNLKLKPKSEQGDIVNYDLIGDGMIVTTLAEQNVEDFILDWDAVLSRRHGATNLQPTKENEDSAEQQNPHFP